MCSPKSNIASMIAWSYELLLIKILLLLVNDNQR